MKQTAESKTKALEVSSAKRGPGRPVTGSAMSSAERQKAYRDRKREEKTAIVSSRNASQEMPPDDGSPRRLIAELDKAHRTVQQLQQQNAALAGELAVLRQAHAELARHHEKLAARDKA